MATWGMVIDLDRCTGCGACQTACRLENNCAPSSSAGDITSDWISVRAVGNGLVFPKAESVFLPKPCMHCEYPPCVAACPVNATQKSRNGIVSQVYARCIGCRSCVAACPYGVRVFNWIDPVWPGTMGATLTPFASVRPKGVVEKCTFCSHRLVAGGQGSAAGTGTACSEACPTGAILFGDLENPVHQVHALSRKATAFTLLPGGKANPRVYYLSSRQWLRQWMQGGRR